MTNGRIFKHADSMAVGAFAGILLANRFMENDEVNIDKESTTAGAMIVGGAVLGAMLGYWNDSNIYNKAFADGARYDPRRTNQNLAYSAMLGAMAGAEMTREYWSDIKSGNNINEEQLQKAAITGCTVVCTAAANVLSSVLTEKNAISYASSIESQRKNDNERNIT